MFDSVWIFSKSSYFSYVRIWSNKRCACGRFLYSRVARRADFTAFSPHVDSRWSTRNPHPGLFRNARTGLSTIQISSTLSTSIAVYRPFSAADGQGRNSTWGKSLGRVDETVGAIVYMFFQYINRFEIKLRTFFQLETDSRILYKFPILFPILFVFNKWNKRFTFS